MGEPTDRDRQIAERVVEDWRDNNECTGGVLLADWIAAALATERERARKTAFAEAAEMVRDELRRVRPTPPGAGTLVDLAERLSELAAPPSVAGEGP